MAQDYFIGPGYDITRMTVLGPGDLLTAIRVPATWAGARFISKRSGIARCGISRWSTSRPAAVFSGDRIDRMRLVVNAVAAHPYV